MDVVISGTLVEMNGELMFQSSLIHEPLHLNVQLPYKAGTSIQIDGRIDVDAGEGTITPNRVLGVH